MAETKRWIREHCRVQFLVIEDGKERTLPWDRVSTDQAQALTFNRDVLPILQKNCQVCHRPGEIAPMSLLTYEDARPWARAMKTAAVTRRMPPWFADPAYGRFAHDRRLTDAEIATLGARADAGAG